MKSFRLSLALRIVLFYSLPAGLWIWLSDRLIDTLLPPSTLNAYVQTFKGWGFVVATSLILYGILRVTLARQERANHELAHANKMLEQHARQQEAIAALRQSALQGAKKAALLEEAATLTALALDVDYVAVFAAEAEHTLLRLCAGTGWREGLVGTMALPIAPDTLAGAALDGPDFITVEDWRTEARLTAPSLLKEHGISSSVSLVIAGRNQPIGVFEVHTSEPRTFSSDEYRFLRAISDVLTTAITRAEAEAEALRQKVLLESQGEASPDGILLIDPDDRMIFFNRRFQEMWHLPPEVLTERSSSFAMQAVLDQLLDPEQFVNRIQGLYRSHSETSHEEVLLKDGRIFDRYSAPVMDDNDAYYGRVWSYRDITDIRQAQEDLRKSEEQFRAFFEQAPIGIGVSRQGITMTVNPAYIRMFGYESLDELVGMPILDCVVSDERQMVLDRVQQRSFGEDLSQRFTFTGLRKDGSQFPIICDVAQVVLTDGKEASVGFMTDITDRKRIEDALRESEERYRLLTENAHDLIYRIRLLPTRGFEYVSPAATEIVGYTPEDHYADPDLAYKLIYPEDLPVLDAVSQGEQPFSVPLVLRWVRKDGSLVWVEQRNVPICDDKGNLVAIEGIARDITDRKQAEEALAASNALLNSILSSLNEAVLVVNPFTRLIYECNRTTETMFGYSRDEVIGQRTRILYVDDEMYRTFGEAALQAYQTGGVFTAEYAMRRKNGEIFSAELFARPIYDEAGNLQNVVGVVRDITQRKKAEERLTQRNQQLSLLNTVTEAANRSLSLADVLATLQNLLAENLHIAGGAIYLYHAEDDQLSLEVAWGLPSTLETALSRFPAATAHNRLVAWEQQPLVLHNLPAELPQLHTLLATGDAPQQDEPWCCYLGVPLLAQGETQGVIDLFGHHADDFSQDHVTFFATLGQQIGSAVQNARLFDVVLAGQERLQILSRRLVEVQEKERYHIARELHDEVGQILTGLNLSLEMLPRLPPDKIGTHLEQARAMISELMQIVREMSLQLRPPMLDDLGLLAALLWHIERYTTQTGIQVALQHSGLEQRRFAPEVEITVYRMVQEALTNVARYADVGDAAVRLWVQSDELGVQIEDQGRGFDPVEILSRHTSSGLSGMRERSLLLGGELAIEAAPGEGCRLTVVLPLNEQEPGAARLPYR
jgi:PAS domain S-box-containing protein